MELLGTVLYEVLDYRGKWYSGINEHEARTVATQVNGKIIQKIVQD